MIILEVKIMNLYINIYDYLRKEISVRVRNKRLEKGLKQLDVLDTGNGYISAIENNRLIKAGVKKNSSQAMNGEKEIRYKNFLPMGIADNIAESFGEDIKWIFFGDDDEIEILVKHIYDRVLHSFKIEEFSEFRIKKKFKYQQFQELCTFFDRLILYDANYVTCLHDIKVKFFFNFFELNESREDDLQKEYLTEFRRVANYIWYKNKNTLVKSFLDLLYDDEENFYLSLMKIDEIVNDWILSEWVPIFEDIYSELSEDSIYNIGYTVHEITEKIDTLNDKIHAQTSKKEIDFFENEFEEMIMEDKYDIEYGILADSEKKEIIDAFKKGKALAEKYRKGSEFEIYRDGELTEYGKKLERLDVEKENAKELIKVYESTYKKLREIQNNGLSQKPYLI